MTTAASSPSACHPARGCIFASEAKGCVISSTVHVQVTVTKVVQQLVHELWLKPIRNELFWNEVK